MLYRVLLLLASLWFATSVVAQEVTYAIASSAVGQGDPLAPEAVSAPGVLLDSHVEPTALLCPTEGCCPTPCAGCRQARLTGWWTAVDLTVMMPSHSNSLRTISGNDPLSGVRFLVGYEGPQGGGVRARIWALDGDVRFAPLPSGALEDAELTFGQFDFDLTQRVWIGDTSLVLGAGPRAALIRLDWLDGTGHEIQASGAGAFVEFRRTFFRGKSTEIAFIGHGRASFLGGEIEVSSMAENPDGTMTLGEAAFGIELRRRLCGGDLVLHYMEEAQMWDSNLFNQMVLHGPSLRLGYQW